MKLLFVCTGNVTRSMSAEYILKKLLVERNRSDIEVSSAGTEGGYDSPWHYTLDALAKKGISVGRHKSQPLPKTLMDAQDVIVCMSQHHKDFVKKYTDTPTFLYNELVLGRETDLEDDVETDEIGASKTLEEFLYDLVDYLDQTMPLLLENIDSADL